MRYYENEADMAYSQGCYDTEMEMLEREGDRAAAEVEMEHYWWKLYYDAVEKFGKESQVIKCIEEMAELTQALCKGDHDNIIEEIVDVRICIDQMSIIFLQSEDDNRLSNDMMRYKRERLQEMIDDE